MGSSSRITLIDANKQLPSPNTGTTFTDNVEILSTIDKVTVLMWAGEDSESLTEEEEDSEVLEEEEEEGGAAV